MLRGLDESCQEALRYQLHSLMQEGKRLQVSMLHAIQQMLSTLFTGISVKGLRTAGSEKARGIPFGKASSAKKKQACGQPEG
jgi:hypothetical protein